MGEISEDAAKQYWKIVHRAMRVARRECRKAEEDMLIYGTGVVIVPDNGDDVKYVPLDWFHVEQSRNK